MMNTLEKFIASTNLFDLIDADNEDGQDYLVVHTQNPIFIAELVGENELEIVTEGLVPETLKLEALAWIMAYKKSVEITLFLNRQNQGG